MLIKGTKKGNAIPMDPKTAVKHAVGRACKVMNTLETVYWADSRTVKLNPDGLKFMTDKDGVWEAWAEGTANIGKTVTKTGLFHKPRPHAFKLHYKLAKDEWGIPDIALMSPPEVAPVENNPAKMLVPTALVVNPAALAREQVGPGAKKPFVKPKPKKEEQGANA
jgi:hypothetical protein